MKILSRNPIWLILILAGTFCVFSPSLLNSFVNWDDPTMLLENRYVQQLSLDNLVHIFSSEFKGKFYPLTMLTFALEFHFFKLMPFFYHLTNVILHLVNIFLVYRFLQRMQFETVTVAIAALLFAVHPLQVESVAWVSSRKDLLAMFFALLALLNYNRGSIRTDRLTFIFFICSLLSKPSAIMFPFLLILFDHYRGQKILFKRYLPFGVITLIFAALTIHMADIAQGFPATKLYGFSERFLFSSYAFVLYLFKFMVPVGLSCYYPLPEKFNGLYPAEVYEAVIPVILLGSLFFLVKNKDFRLTAGWFIISILPVLHLIRINDSVIYERFVYLPLIGISLGVGLLLQYIVQYRKVYFRFIVIFLFTMWVTFLAFTSWNRCFVWRNGVALWTDVAEQYADLPLAYLNRGEANYQLRWDDAALKDFTQVIKLSPNPSEGYFNRGIIYADRKDTVRAVEEYNRAIDHDPVNVKAYNNRGNLYSDLGKDDAAIDDYSRMLELEPDNIFALLNRGITLQKQGKFEQSMMDFQRVLAIDPKNKFAAKMIIDIKGKNNNNPTLPTTPETQNEDHF